MTGLCVRDLDHHFDPASGWCVNGCGWREDGLSQYRLPRTITHVPDRTEPRVERNLALGNQMDAHDAHTTLDLQTRTPPRDLGSPQ